MASALDGLRVLDCSEGLAGPMAAMYLADFGAQVVRVEPPGGGRDRALPGFPFWNRNKRSLTLDLERSEHRGRLRALLRGADVCLFSQPLRTLARLGLDPVSVRELNPALVYLHTPALSEHGPYADLPESAQLVSAATGVATLQYSFEDVPIDPVIPHVLCMQAIWGATAAVAALIERQRSGYGQTVTVGGLQGMLAAMAGIVTQPVGMPRRRGAGGPGGPVPHYRVYRCGDGEHLFLAALTPRFYTVAYGVLGVLDQLLADPGIDGELARTMLPDNAARVIALLNEVFATRPRDEWLATLSGAGVPCGPVLDRDTWLNHPQVEAIGMRLQVHDAERGTVVMPGLPVTLSAAPASVRSPAPQAGEHDAAPPEWPPLPAPAELPQARGGPLAGVTVLDLGAIIAGPFAASLLAQLGADVIKVEPPDGDSFRYSVSFAGYNLGKRSIALDLRSESGRAAFYRLVERADVVVDNYRPGVLERLQIGYDALRRMNSRIISVTITGYGESGPLGGEAGFDPLLQAQSGMMRAQGGESDPVFFTLPVNDVGSAASAALGAVFALYHRGRTGEGQRVTTSLAAQSLIMQGDAMVRYERRPAPLVGERDFQGPGPLDRYYRTSDGWLRLQAVGPHHIAALAALGLLPREAQMPDAIRHALQGAFARMSTEEALDLLRPAAIPAAPAHRLTELLGSPFFETEDAARSTTLANGAGLWTIGSMAALSRSRTEPPTVVPGLGEHSVEVLMEAGCSEDEIAGLIQSGAVRTGGPYTIG